MEQGKVSGRQRFPFTEGATAVCPGDIVAEYLALSLGKGDGVEVHKGCYWLFVTGYSLLCHTSNQ